MKKIFVLGILSALLFSVNAQVQLSPAKTSSDAQSAKAASVDQMKCGNKDCQTMMKLKREYISENFTLQENQKEAFWKAYDAYTNAEFKAFQEQREAKEAAGIPRMHPDSTQQLTDEQILASYRIKLETRAKLLKAEMDFFNALTKCLTAEQVDEYYKLEHKFKRSAASHKTGGKHVPHAHPQMGQPRQMEAKPMEKK